MNAKSYNIPYVKLLSCDVDEEDGAQYNLANDDNAWEKYAVELYKNSAGEVRYKHVGVSNTRNQAYCLGDAVFGPNKDMFPGAKAPSKDDFVLLFPCEPNPTDSAEKMKTHYDSLVKYWHDVNSDPKNVNSKVSEVRTPHLGYPTTLTTQTSSKKEWTRPHPCPCGYEPNIAGGGCLDVDTCRYDASVCPENSFCQEDHSSCECEDGYLR